MAASERFCICIPASDKTVAPLVAIFPFSNTEIDPETFSIPVTDCWVEGDIWAQTGVTPEIIIIAKKLRNKTGIELIRFLYENIARRIIAEDQ